MKTVYLWAKDEPGKVASYVLRGAILSLARHACLTPEGKNRCEGDEVFERVTERRQSQNTKARKTNPNIYRYSACGDLPHYCLACVGCKDETLVNRDSDGGKTPWKSGVNINRIVTHKSFVSADSWTDPYQLGDILCVHDPNKPNSEHVCILAYIQEFDDGSKEVTTYDYGQIDQETGLPCGKCKINKVTVKNDQIWIGDRVLIGWLNVDRVDLSDDPAVVPDDFPLGVETDNPY